MYNKSFSNHNTSRHKCKFLSILLIPFAFLIKWLASIFPEVTEKYYSRGIYKYLMQPLSQFTGLSPFSAIEIIIILLVVYIIIRIIYLTIKAIRTRTWTTFLPFISNAVLLTSLWFFISTILWNINYERLSFSENAGIEVRESSVDELANLCEQLIKNTNALRAQVKEDKNGVMKIDGGFQYIAENSQRGYTEVQRRHPYLGGEYGRPKPVLLSRLMSHTNIIGIYSVLTGEANIDTDIPDFEQPSTTMHEMAHQRGFAREDEANYIAYLTCMAHPDINFKYSGSVLALQYSMNALYSADSERYTALTDQYSLAYRRDLNFNSAYWKQFQGVTKIVSNKVNDSYLKLNGEADGVKSYGRMVDLLLAEYREKK